MIVTLGTLGIEVSDPGASPAYHAEVIRIARKLLGSECQTVGLIGATADIAIAPIGVQIALAFVELRGGHAFYLDAARPRGIPALAAEDHLCDSTFQLSVPWRSGSLTLLAPDRSPDTGPLVPSLVSMLGRHKNDLPLLVDLSGFDRSGEQTEAFALLAGSAVVAFPGRTREDALLRWQHLIPQDRNLGMILLGDDERR